MSVQIQLDIANLLKDIQKVQTQVVITNAIRTLLQQKGQNISEVNPQLSFQADLKFALADIIELMDMIEKKFQRRLSFAQLLMKNGEYVKDLTVDELIGFVTQQLVATP